MTDIGSLVRQARRLGRLELVEGSVIVEGRFPKALIDTLRERKEEVCRVLQQADVGSPADHASRVSGVPTIHVTVRETPDVEGDMAFLRRVRLVLGEHPGGNLAVVTIRTLDGRKVRAEWRAMAEPTLRRRLALLLRDRAEAEGTRAAGVREHKNNDG